MADNQLIRHDEQIKALRERQDKTEGDLSDIKDSISNLDKNVALFAQSMTEVITHNQKQDEAFKEQYLKYAKLSEERADMTQVIHAELQEIRASQEVLYTKMESKDAKHDEELEKLREDFNYYRKNLEIETKRLEDTLDVYVGRTKVDWLEILSDGINTIVAEGLKYGIVATVVYGALKLKEKFV